MPYMPAAPTSAQKALNFGSEKAAHSFSSRAGEKYLPARNMAPSTQARASAAASSCEAKTTNIMHRAGRGGLGKEQEW
eukprot:1184988-Prorocentrum_minimum.AAC.1